MDRDDNYTPRNLGLFYIIRVKGNGQNEMKIGEEIMSIDNCKEITGCYFFASESHSYFLISILPKSETKLFLHNYKILECNKETGLYRFEGQFINLDNFRKFNFLLIGGRQDMSKISLLTSKLT